MVAKDSSALGRATDCPQRKLGHLMFKNGEAVSDGEGLLRGSVMAFSGGG
jgi:hypothetical protein